MAADESPHQDDRQREYQELSKYPEKADVFAAEPRIGLAHDKRADDAPLNVEAPKEVVHRHTDPAWALVLLDPELYKSLAEG